MLCARRRSRPASPSARASRGATIEAKGREGALLQPGRRVAGRRLLAMLATLHPLSFAASAATPLRVGMLFFGSAPAGGNGDQAIVRELASLGWIEGRTIGYAMRYANGRRESYPALAAELSRLPLDAIFCIGSDVARAFLGVEATVPVIFAVSDDPVASGMVRSLARPGGRFTGVSFMSPELAGKRLEILKAVVPALRRVAVLTDAAHDALYVPAFERAAGAMDVAPLPLHFEAASDFPAAFARAVSAGAQAMFVVPSRYTLAYARDLAALSIAHRLPAISAYDTFARSGGLMSYGPTMEESLKRAASFVDRVLKGASPATLPVEQPARHVLLVNRQAAAALSLALPESVLLQAVFV